MRRLTIGSIFSGDHPTRFFPFIRLRGRWLENMGWFPGQIIEVTATKEEIVIRKVNGSALLTTSGAAELTIKGGNENDNQPANC